MGYVKKSDMMMTNDGRPYTYIGIYKIVKNSEHMTAIYSDYGNTLVTSKPKWSQAIKLAKLLNVAYKEGYSEARSNYCEDSWRD